MPEIRTQGTFYVDHFRLSALSKHAGVTACAVIFAGSLAFSFVQAARAPITYDEAYTYVHFARKPSSRILQDYHLPNNHILHTLLVRASTLQFGNSEFAIRLPALFGGGLLFFALGRIGRDFAPHVGPVWAMLVALTPTVIEYNAYARGYSLGCGLSFSALALLATLSSCDSKSKRTSRHRQKGAAPPIKRGRYGFVRVEMAKVVGAGMLLGMAVACVPVFGIFAAAVSIAFFALVMFPINRTSLVRAVVGMAILAGSAAPVVAAVYWHVAVRPSEWLSGHDNFIDSVGDLFRNAYNQPQPAGHSYAWLLLALVALLTLWGFARARRKGDRVAGLILMTLVFSVVGLTAARAALGTMWPLARTILFLIPLVLFALLYAPLGLLGRFQRAPVAVSCALVGLQLLTTVSWVDPGLHHGWRKYAAVRQALSTIDAHRGDQADVIVSVPVEIANCVTYYLMRRPRLGLEFDVRRPWGSKDSPPDTADFAIGFSAEEAHGWRWKGRIIGEDPHSGVVVLQRD